MKRVFKTIVAAIAVAYLTTGVSNAQEPNGQLPVDHQPNVQDRYEANKPALRNDAGRLDAKTRGTAIRVSQLMGLNIQNSQGESVGEINDIVLDSRTGKVRYAAVTYGGFLGVGNKMFAVPFEAFKVQVDPDEAGDDDIDADDYVMVLDVTQQQLEGQQGFDEDNWPNMADRRWAAELNERYNVNQDRDASNRGNRVDRERNRQNQ
ncbi:sporulation protein YlmC with PRC-barrel domain [Rhodopirellula rubra]|uniref:Sporulation protein YlmC with PRC-barrel domain n=1 Tax=Aporhodopirellula rubra TaxID=980271 RepID=A0A7W5DYJ0_9BACT|nr:PRC-barrel domain-containing protein [Aporhodopirellula rubra]MBB3206795.1 sporulation protein YlmC with PRC-barrel domain [Aporhodopirellula rubra]